ncbi:MAG: alpha/beta hydrolase [Desulfobacteraceae bacterium]|nr:alpha/beta hydrolase [Desulfobacteraceae bacterium]
MNSRVLSSILKHLKSMPTFDQVGIKRYRTLLEVSAKAFKPDKNIKFQPLKINEIKAERIIPEDLSSNKTILFLHGGGFVAGSINSHRDLASRIAKASKAEVIIIDYRLAPEHPHPAGLDDASTSYKWLLEQNLKPDQIAIVGDSAGGGLTLALLAKIRTLDLPMPCAAVFLSPWVDLENKNKSIKEKDDVDPMLNKDMLDQTARLYSNKQDITNPFISPINNDLTGLCPILIHVGENEVLLDDSLLLEQKARGAGVKTTIEVFDNMFHVFQYFARYLSRSRASIKKIGLFIQQK